MKLSTISFFVMIGIASAAGYFLGWTAVFAVLAIASLVGAGFSARSDIWRGDHWYVSIQMWYWVDNLAKFTRASDEFIETLPVGFRPIAKFARNFVMGLARLFGQRVEDRIGSITVPDGEFGKLGQTSTSSSNSASSSTTG